MGGAGHEAAQDLRPAHRARVAARLRCLVRRGTRRRCGGSGACGHDRVGSVRQPVRRFPGRGHLPAGLRQLRQSDRAQSRELRRRLQLHAGRRRPVHRGDTPGGRIGLDPSDRLRQLHGERRVELHGGQPRARRGSSARGAEGPERRAQRRGARPGHPGVTEAGSGHRQRRGRRHRSAAVFRLGDVLHDGPAGHADRAVQRVGAEDRHVRSPWRPVRSTPSWSWTAPPG